MAFFNFTKELRGVANNSLRLRAGAALLVLATVAASLSGCQSPTSDKSQTPAESGSVAQKNSPAPVESSSAAQTPLSRLTIVFPSRSGSSDLENKAKAVAQFLSKELGMPVEAALGDDTAAVEALRANTADVAFLSSRPAMKAEELAGARLALAEVRKDYSGGHTYKSLIVVREDSPLQAKATPKETLDQLKGKKMAFASRTSGSGFIIPTGELVNQGLVDGPDRLETFFGQVTYGDGYSSALQAVLQDQADVGAVSEYALKPPYVTEDEAKQLRVLHAIPGVPAHGVAIDDDVPAAQQEQIVNALMKLNEPANNQLLQGLYNSTELVKVDHNSHLEPMRTALKRAGMKP